LNNKIPKTGKVSKPATQPVNSSQLNQPSQKAKLSSIQPKLVRSNTKRNYCLFRELWPNTELQKLKKKQILA